MDEHYLEVYFHEYCKKCKHSSKNEEEYPCCECLESAANFETHAPVKYEKE